MLIQEIAQASEKQQIKTQIQEGVPALEQDKDNVLTLVTHQELGRGQDKALIQRITWKHPKQPVEEEALGLEVDRALEDVKRRQRHRALSHSMNMKSMSIMITKLLYIASNIMK